MSPWLWVLIIPVGAAAILLLALIAVSKQFEEH